MTLNPVNEVKFKILDKEKERLQSAATLEPSDLKDVKPIASIQIINKSQAAILFKVSDTNALIRV